MRTAQLLLSVALASCPYLAPSVEAQARSSLLVSAEWLAEHLGEPNLVVIETGREADYDAGHIPGAHYMSLSDISLPQVEGALRLQLAPVDELQKAFERAGVRDDSRIVVSFSGRAATQATRIFFALDYLGLGDRAAVLDGGLEAWKASGGAISTERPEMGTGSFTPSPNPALVAEADWLLEHSARDDIDILDARDAAFYLGERESMGGRGRIPTARNIQFSELLGEDLRFNDADDLRELFVAASVTVDDTVVTYCHIGQQASLLYFVSRYLGYETKLYDGSFDEWVKRGLPTEQ